MKNAKIEQVSWPEPLTNVDKADLADELLDLRDEMQGLKDQREEFLKQHKDQVAELETRIEYRYKVLKNGTKQHEGEARIRKNFDAEPPVIEYVDLDDDKKVLHSIPMEPEHYQLEAGEWIVGEAKEVPPMESKSEELDEEDLDD